MRAKEFDAEFMDRVRAIFEEKGSLVQPNPVQWSNITALPHYYVRQLPFTLEEHERRGGGHGLFDYIFKGTGWTYTLQLELRERKTVNTVGHFYDRTVYDLDFEGNEDAFESDMLTAKLML